MKTLWYIISVAFPFALWFLIADVLHLPPALLLPDLSDVLIRLKQIIADGSLLKDAAATLSRWACGFSLGVLAGCVCGLWLGLQPRVYKLFEFTIEFFRAMPITAIFPLFLIVFGVGDASKIAMAFLATFLLMLINAAYGVMHASTARITMAQVFGASRFQVFCHVVFFEALPQMFIGLRLAISLSLVVAVVAEMFIGTDAGLGQRIYDAYLTNSVGTLYAVLLTLGVIGYALNKALLYFEKRIVYWTGQA